MDRDIWRATDQQARAILAEEGIDLTEEETPVLLDHLPFYLDAALKECVLALARQQLKRRGRGDGECPGGTRGQARARVGLTQAKTPRLPGCPGASAKGFSLVLAEVRLPTDCTTSWASADTPAAEQSR